MQKGLLNRGVFHSRCARSVALQEKKEAGGRTAQEGKGAHSNPEAYEVGLDEMTLVMERR